MAIGIGGRGQLCKLTGNQLQVHYDPFAISRIGRGSGLPLTLALFFGTPVKYVSLVTGVNLTGQIDD